MSKSKVKKIRAINDQGDEQFFPELTWKAMPVGTAGDRFGWFAADVKQESRPVAITHAAPATPVTARRGRPASTAPAAPAEDVNSD